jgi:hypothetical protein
MIEGLEFFLTYTALGFVFVCGTVGVMVGLDSMIHSFLRRRERAQRLRARRLARERARDAARQVVSEWSWR